MFSLTWFNGCSFLFLFTYFNNDSISEIQTSPVAMAGLVSSVLPNLNMKQYKSAKILSNFRNVKSPCANLNPLFKTFRRRFWLLNLMFSCNSLIAFDSYQSEKVRNTRIVNLTVTTICVSFTCRVLLVCVRFLQPW